jgi:hypothetical protein
MKLMDEVAGIVAARHCKTNIVTASVDAINFHDKIRKGKRSLPRKMRGQLFEVAGATSLCAYTCCLPVSQEKQEDSCALPFAHTGEAAGGNLTGTREASAPDLQRLL